MKLISFFILFVFVLVPVLCGSTNLIVDLSNSTHDVSPSLFGIFFEEINHAGEGGLYGELVQNRAFDAQAPSTLSAPQQVSIVSAAHPNYYVRHCYFFAYVSPISSTLDDEDSTFTMVAGLDKNASTVSFESVDYPGYYLRHQNFRLQLQQTDGTALFASDASFVPGKALDGSAHTSFEASNYPGYYWSMNSTGDGSCSASPKYDIYLSPLEDTASYRTNATFSVSAPNYSASAPWVVIQEGGASTNFSLDNSNPLSAESAYAGKIVASGYSSSTSYSGIANPGFWGINAKPDTYSLSFYARAGSDFTGELVVTLESSDGSKVYGKVMSTALTGSWKQYTYSMAVGTGVSDPNARLAIRLSKEGTVWLDIVSLFPTTFKNRKNGLRPDLANLLVDMAPKFVRFPGGCYVEGSSVATAYLWKNSTGPIINRPGHYSFWGYWSTDGLGYLEYLQLCEDLGAEPIFVLHLGIFTGDSSIPYENLGPWIQDALDAIEYANGDNSTVWGAKRVQDGHPAPFGLTTVALGNENGCNFDSKGIYVKYFTAFATPIKAKYPNMKIIANCDISKQTGNVDYYDVHLYESPTWMVTNANMFDSYSRTGPKAFVSEYAVTSDCGNGNVQAAVAEAAFMIGLIRNSDVVALASYAPLFVNVNNRAWNPDAIQFDSSRTAPTPSFYVQELFAKYTGASVLASGLYNAPSGLSAISTYTKSTQTLYITIVNFAATSVSIPITIQHTTSIDKTASVYVLSGNPTDENSLDAPTTVVPKTSSITASPSFTFSASPYSVSILVIGAA